MRTQSRKQEYWSAQTSRFPCHSCYTLLRYSSHRGTHLRSFHLAFPALTQQYHCHHSFPKHETNNQTCVLNCFLLHKPPSHSSQHQQKHQQYWYWTNLTTDQPKEKIAVRSPPAESPQNECRTHSGQAVTMSGERCVSPPKHIIS